MTWIVAFILLAGLVVLGAWLARDYLGGNGGGLFGAPKEKRIDVVEHTSLDGRRRLVLIRRDNVEHLIMTGGPVDVVIETNIGAARVAERPRVAAVDGATGERVQFGRVRGERQAAEG